MKVLVALPTKHNHFNSIDEVLEGKVACSGTYGSIIRLANLLSEAGFNVCLSAYNNINSTKFPCIKHQEIDAQDFDCLIVHQSHWDGTSLTFGNQVLSKTILWLHTFIPFALVYTFLKEGGKQVVCVSEYHANFYRSLPQWQEKISIIHNTYSSVFKAINSDDELYETSKPILLFIGAISRDKGFYELTQMWSYLASRRTNLELAIAGSANVHTLSQNQKIGSMGIGDTQLEENCIKPWLKSLPKDYQPNFLGALSPLELRRELNKSWAVIVNPGCNSPETFCVSAVEAQACKRTVFSVSFGALKETVYRHNFNSLDEKRQVKSTAELVISGLKQKERVHINGCLSAQFVENKFSSSKICNSWINLINGNKNQTLPNTWHEMRDLANDLMRLTKTGLLVQKLKYSTNRQIMEKYLLVKKP